MLAKLAAVVFFAAIAVFFSQEFTRMFKKIFEIKRAKFVLPLALFSYLVCVFENQVLIGALHYRECLQKIVNCLIGLMPFREGAYSVSLVFLLTFISVAPVFFWDAYLVKTVHKRFKYSYEVSALILLVSAVVLLAPIRPWNV